MLLMLQQGRILEKKVLLLPIRRASIGSEGTSRKEKLQFADQFVSGGKFYRHMPNVLYNIYF